MSDHFDETQGWPEEQEDWPLREYSIRLRPPHGQPVEEERIPEERPVEPAAPEPGPESLPPESLPLGGDVQSGGEELPAGGELLDDDELREDETVAPAAEAEPVPPPEAEPALPPEAEPALPPEAEPALPPEAEVAAPAPVEEHVAGELRVPGGYPVLEGAPKGERRSVAIVVSRFNGEITNRLLDRTLAELDEAGVAPEGILVMPVPGAFELPIAAMALAKTRRYACVIALGAIIRGETPHFDFVAGEAASGLQLAGIETGVPVAFGVLTCETVEQAEARIDRAAAAARSALEMADAFSQLRTLAAPRAPGA